MAYFLLLPAWILALLGMIAATIATRAVPRWAPAYPFAWRILLGSTVGVLAANGALLGVFLPVARTADAGGGGVRRRVPHPDPGTHRGRLVPRHQHGGGPVP